MSYHSAQQPEKDFVENASGKIQAAQNPPPDTRALTTLPKQSLQSQTGSSPGTRKFEKFEKFAFLGVLILAAIVRIWQLNSQPLQAYERIHSTYAQLFLHDNLQHWQQCAGTAAPTCYHYNPAFHGPISYMIEAGIYQITQWLSTPVNNTSLRLASALMGIMLVGLPYFLRSSLGRLPAWIASLLLALSPSVVYFSRVAREDIFVSAFSLLLIVATVRYRQTHKLYWMLLSVSALVLAYASKETTLLVMFLGISFGGALVIWESSNRWYIRSQPLSTRTNLARWLPGTGAPYLLGMYIIGLGIAIRILLGWLISIGQAINKHPTATSDTLKQLNARTDFLLPWLGACLALVALLLLFHEYLGHIKEGPATFVRRIDPERQPILNMLAHTTWIYWFLSLVWGSILFIILFTALFSNLHAGIGDGIWRATAYWLGQLQATHTTQPWYYYLQSMQLVEQISLLLALMGILYSLRYPTYLRLWLSYWFLGTAIFYSWIGEKGPWLQLQILLPMLLLSALGIELIVRSYIQLRKNKRHIEQVGSIISIEEAIDNATNNE
ncbi:glycosyltransferase family 39 protein [Dictyobacter arantiisoli]|uniref:Glycosyltransferase RgtA/B/C/D-like domain-containing protein n=1 Tax=Dictyobacter arantiisoli TaxID=2014874 RepID=A0A5A5TEM3_9CHLR|nr:glycosyltransferase family 39 protein [Dictyobacter arantiisoli]GCF09459.1 hypothetical protein KDI_30230 [Dictyobacter arantiisoli]